MRFSLARWLALLTLAVSLAAQDVPALAITSPQTGDILRGQVIVTGTTDIPNFASAELDFAYASDPSATWFLLQTFSQPVADATLAAWDITSLTDGDYDLRLRVFLQDGTYQEVVITDLYVRNDVKIETPTSIPASTSTPESASMPSLPTPTSVPATNTPMFPTPTPLSGNPASLTTPTIYSTFGRGALVTLISSILIGLFLRLRRSS